LWTEFLQIAVTGASERVDERAAEGRSFFSKDLDGDVDDVLVCAGKTVEPLDELIGDLHVSCHLAEIITRPLYNASVDPQSLNRCSRKASS